MGRHLHFNAEKTQPHREDFSPHILPPPYTSLEMVLGTDICPVPARPLLPSALSLGSAAPLGFMTGARHQRF